MSDADRPAGERYRDACAELTARGMPAADVAAVERFILAGEGDAADVATKLDEHRGWIISYALPRSDRTRDEDRRAIQLLIRLGHEKAIATWLKGNLADEREGENLHSPVAELMRDIGMPEVRIAELSGWSSCERADGQLSSSGRYLLSVEPAFLVPLAAGSRNMGLRLCFLLLRHGRNREQHAVEVIAAINDEDERAFAEIELARAFPDKYADAVLGRTLIAMKRNGMLADSFASEVLGAVGARSAPMFAAYMATPGTSAWDIRVRTAILAEVVERLGAAGVPVLVSAAEHAEPPVRLEAVRQLVELEDPQVEPQLAAALEGGLSEPPRTAAKFAALAGRSRLPQFRERLWAMLDNKSKLLRDGAAEGIAAGDPAALDRAAGLLADKAKERRLGAVRVLAGLGTAEACDCLLNWLPREKDPEVRNEVTAALREGGTDLKTIFAGLAPVSLDELRQRAAAVKTTPAKWLDERELLGGGDPSGAKGPRLGDGTPLGPDLARYLLRQQSKQTDPIPDPEVAALYATIDRRTSGDFAHRLLNAFLESGRGKAGAWALVTAGVLGDNRVVTALAAQARKWADSYDQKLGEWGIEALALNGSDAALMAVDAIARKYRDSTRRKQAVIGEAAQDAIEKAARRQGVSLDELGDRIVPAFGFEPGRPRVIEAGKRSIEATIGLDFKLALKDAATGKRAATVPKAAAAEAYAEFKGLGKLLQDVAKAQSARLEGLMVRQHRWPGGRWRELFLRHPLLFPFAVRLVWATYDDAGRPAATFRALPDRSLTNANDDPADPPADDASVGLVHPLDLSPEQVEAWRTHLGDYEIAPPFEQVDRRVVTVPDDLRGANVYGRLNGATLNGLGFRGKAERSGWSRAATGDGGMVYAYRKRFPALAVDAFVTLDGLPAWADPAATVTLGDVLFAPTDATPSDFEQRRLKLGDVPVMAFCESVGDLMRISGRGDEPASEADRQAS